MSRYSPAFAALALAVLLGAACGSDDAEPAAVGVPTTSTTAGDEDEAAAGDTAPTAAPEEGDGGPSATPEAELRADLTALLSEHVYLASETVDEVLAGGAEAPAATAANDTLDETSVSLADVVGTALDPEVGEDFLGLWRDHVTSYLAYASATAASDGAGQQLAGAELEAFGGDTAELLDSATDGALAADAVSQDLDTHTDAMLLALDAIVAGNPDAVSLVHEAAAHMPDTAALWAAGLVEVEGAA